MGYLRRVTALRGYAPALGRFKDKKTNLTFAWEREQLSSVLMITIDFDGQNAARHTQ